MRAYILKALIRLLSRMHILSTVVDSEINTCSKHFQLYKNYVFLLIKLHYSGINPNETGYSVHLDTLKFKAKLLRIFSLSLDV